MTRSVQDAKVAESLSDWARWKATQASDQEGLYSSFFVRLLFDPGHRWLAGQAAGVNGPIVDVGCGMGYLLRFMNDSRLTSYVCMDEDITMLQRIDRPVRKVSAAGGGMPFCTGSVAAIIASHVLEHVHDLDSCLAEFERVLHDRGRLFVVLPCDPGFMWQVLTRVSPSRRRLKRLGVDYDAVMKEEHVNTFTKCRDALCGTFRLHEEVYYPLRIPTYHANVVCGLSLSK